jgi:hypothetical protein
MWWLVVTGIDRMMDLSAKNFADEGGGVHRIIMAK